MRTCFATLLTHSSLRPLPEHSQLAHLPLRLCGFGVHSAVDALQSSTETFVPLAAARHAAIRQGMQAFQDRYELFFGKMHAG